MSNDHAFSSLELLETRLLYSQTPADPRPDSLGKAFDLGERQVLFSRLGNLPASTYALLSKDLKARKVGAFDSTLLDYMRNRSSSISYFFAPGDAQSIANYTKANIGVSAQETHANDVTDDRLFPEASSVSSYTVQLPAAINWNDASKSSNPEYLSALNRQEWWVDLAQSYLYTSNTKYSNELAYELASFQQQDATFTLPAKTTAYTSYGFDMSIRVDNWMMSYFSLLGSNVFTGAENSLFLYKFMQQGDVLSTVSSNITDYTSNRTISIGKAELMLGDVFPEFNKTNWTAQGQAVLFNSMDGQLYQDGTQREQSPGYAITVVDDVLEARQIDKLNGIAWPSAKLTQLTNAVTAIWQELSPDGLRAAIGDTYRLNGTTLFLKAQTVLDTTQWPDNAPSMRDAYVLGIDAIAPDIHVSGMPALGNRGTTALFADSGNYVIRSGDDANARQVSFIAGPKGGDHGHYDYMSFELSGYGRPLIADPGVYQYDDSATRNWITSAAAHNTIAVAGVNPGDLEDSTDITTSGITSVAGGGEMISASYNGYSFLDGNPTLGRTIYYDGNNTMVIVDFAQSSAALSYETGFTLENQNTTRDLAAGTIYTKNASGGNVRIQSLLLPGEEATVQTQGIITSSNPPPDDADPATRYQVGATKTTFAVFATVITAYNGSAASAVNNVTWQRTPTKPGQSAILNVNGQSITFLGPAFDAVGKDGAVRGTDNAIAYDSKGRLHEVFYDRDAHDLKYAVMGTNGVWSNIETIDPGYECGFTPSLVIDANDRPAVAYQDANQGDLKYAYLSPITNSWVVQTVDSKGSTGSYPSLVMSRHNTADIAYYTKATGDLRLAQQDTDTRWIISTIDSKGDVGRFPSLQLDPNRPTATKFAIAYEDTTNGSFKYALQSNSSYLYQTIDDATTIAGGYISMQFYQSGAAYYPAVSYYDAGKTQLKYAVSNGKSWSSLVVATQGRQGLYSQLAIDGSTPRIFFYDATRDEGYLLTSTKISGGKWSIGDLGAGGCAVHYAEYKGKFAYTSLNEATGYLNTY